MPVLYVANCTKQRHMFVYRVPDEPKRYLSVPIEVGEQVRIWKDAPRPQIQDIIMQKEYYGMRSAQELPNMKEFVGLCYSVDAPIDMERVVDAVRNNDGHLQRVSEEFRAEAAVALNNDIDRTDPGNLRSLEVEVEELPKKGETANARKVRETIEVVREGVEPRRRH